MLNDDIKTIANFIRRMKNGGSEDTTVSLPSSNVSNGHPWLGEKVLIRTESAGVHYGRLNYVDGSIVPNDRSRNRLKPLSKPGLSNQLKKRWSKKY